MTEKSQVKILTIAVDLLKSFKAKIKIVKSVEVLCKSE